MLIITNGRVLVDPAMNLEKMETFIFDLTSNLNDLFEEEIVFEKIEEPFLMYKIPDDIAWKNILNARPPEIDIKFMAIGSEDEVQLPYSQRKTVQHYFTSEELLEMADQMTSIIEEIHSNENEKKLIAKKLGEKIGKLNNDLDNIARSHRRKFEDIDMSVYVIMNFKEGMKYYHNTNTGELVGSEKMTENDQRTLFDIKGYNPDSFNEENIKGFEIGTPDIDQEEETELNEMSSESGENIESGAFSESEAFSENQENKENPISMEEF